MYLVIRPGAVYQLAHKGGAHALALGIGGKVNRGFIAALPDAGIVVGVIERPAQVFALVGFGNEGGAVHVLDVAQVFFALSHGGGGGIKDDIGMLDGPVEGIGHGGDIAQVRWSD